MGKASITISVGALWNGSTQLKQVKSALKGIEKLTAANSASTTSALGQMGLEWENLGNRVYAQSKKIADLGDKLTKSITAPMSALGGYAVYQATSFDTSLANLNKTADLTAQELEEFGQAALEASKTSPVTAQEILDAEALGAQLGISTEALKDFADTANGLDIATNLSMETAATNMAQFLNIMNESDSATSNYGSTLVDLGNHLATTESDISEMSLRLAGASTAANLSSADVLGLAGAMASLGIKAEAGGSSMTTIISNISSAVAEGGNQVEEYARICGTSAEEFAAKWQSSPIEAMEDLIAGASKLVDSGEDVTQVLSDMGVSGIRQTDVMRRLIGSGDTLRESVQMANDAWRENTALATEVSKRNESLESRFQTLQNKVNAAATEVGTVLANALLDLTDDLSPIIDGIGDLATAFKSMDSSTQTAITTMAGMTAAAGPVLSITGRLGEGLGVVTSKVANTVEGFAVFGDALNTVDGSQMRVYASSSSLASTVGTAGNAAAKAAGGAEKYVSAWESMVDSAKVVEDADAKLIELSNKYQGASKKKAAAIEKEIEAVAAQGTAAKKAYTENAKLVSQWSGSTSEATKAADGISALSGSLEEVAADFKSTSSGAKGSSTAMKALSGVVKTAGSALADFGISLGISAAVAGLTAAVGLAIEKYTEWKAKQELVNGAMQSADGIISKHASAVGSMGDAYAALEPDIDGLLQSMQSANESFADSLDTFSANAYQVDNYANTIAELADKSNLTAAEQAKLKIAVQGYNDITGSSIEITDTANGKLVDTATNAEVSADKIKAMGDAWVYNAKQQAYANAAAGYFEEQAKAEVELSKATAKYNEALSAQNTYYEKNKDVIDAAKNGTMELSQENQDILNGYAALVNEVGNYSDEVDEAQKCVDQMAENADACTDAMSNLEDELAGVKETLGGFSDELGSGFTDALAGAGLSIDELSTSFANAGVSSEQLASIGAANFQALAEACNYNVDGMIAAVNNYNGTPLLNKDGSVNVNDAELTDATGQVYVWNGTALVNKETQAVADVSSVIDAKGQLWEWDGTLLANKEANAVVVGSGVDDEAKKKASDTNKTIQSMKNKTVHATAEVTGKNKVDALKDSISRLTSKSVYITTYETTVKRSKSGNAAGGFVAHAAGGFVKRFHGNGAIVNNPGPGIPLDYVGEDGAEAIVPLTNRKYAMPFVRMIADETVKQGGSSGPNIYINGVNVNNYADIMEATRDYLLALKQYSSI